MSAVVETKSTSQSSAFKLPSIMSYSLSRYPANDFLCGSLTPLLVGIFSTMRWNESVYSGNGQHVLDNIASDKLLQFSGTKSCR